jgi:hypothetical protein
MRNTTKLKQILLKYDLALSMQDDGLLQLSLVDKDDGSLHSFEHASYSHLISKAYSHLLRELKITVSGKGAGKRPAARKN